MPVPYSTQRRVEFRNTDAAGIIHYSTYFAWMEEAEHEALRDLGLSVMATDETGTISWPRVSATCDFVGTVKFEDQVRCDVHVDRLGSKSVTYEFTFFHGERKIAVGKMTSVCCRVATDGSLQSIPIPDHYVVALQKLT